MKRFIVALILVLTLTLVLAAPAMAAPGNGNGAVKVDLVYDPYDNNSVTPDVEVIGSVVINTNADGIVIVVVNVDDMVCENWDIRIFIEGCGKVAELMDGFNTNAQGQGNAQFKAEIPCCADVVDGNIDVQVNVGANLPPASIGDIWGTGHTSIPLK